jgi:hypothetical protein
MADLKLLEGQIKFSSDAEEVARELYGKSFGSLTPEETAAVNVLRNQRKVEEKKAGRTQVTVDAGSREENQFMKDLGGVQAKRLGDAYTQRDAAIRELRTFEQLASLPDNQLISGTLAEPRVEMAKFLVTAGLASEKDAQRVSTSEQFTKMSNDLVLARIRQLGHNPSNADLTFIERTIPRLSNSPAARREMVAFMAKIAQGIVEEVGSMEEYAMQNRTLSGYKPRVPQVSIGGGKGSGGASGMTKTAEDTAALEWANANPRDPRAAQIKQRLGVQ